MRRSSGSLLLSLGLLLTAPAFGAGRAQAGPIRLATLPLPTSLLSVEGWECEEAGQARLLDLAASQGDCGPTLERRSPSPEPPAQRDRAAGDRGMPAADGSPQDDPTGPQPGLLAAPKASLPRLGLRLVPDDGSGALRTSRSRTFRPPR
jgi:hypothetical protein